MTNQMEKPGTKSNPVSQQEGAIAAAGRMPLRSALCCFLGALIWGTAFVAQSVGGEIHAVTFVGLRFLMGAVVLLPLLIVRKRARSMRMQQGDRTVREPDHKAAIKGGLICGTALFLASWLQQVAIPEVAVGKAGFLTALYIIIVPFLSLIFTRRSNAKVWIGAVIAAVGLYFLCMKPGEEFSIGRWELCLILCAFAFSVQIMCVDHFAPQTDGVELSFMQFLTTGVLGTVLAAVSGNLTLTGVSQQAILSLCYAGIFSSGIAYTLQVVGQKGADPAISSLIMSLESVISAVSGFLFLHQTLSVWELIGCVLMASAIVLVQLPSRRIRTSTLSALVCLLGISALFSGCASAPGTEGSTAASSSAGERQLLQAGEYQAAVDSLTARIDGGEDTEENHRLLGIAYMGLGDYESAASALESALTESGIAPTEIEYDINDYLGVCYYKLGNYDEALGIYDAIVAMRPKDADAIELRGAVKLKLGDTDGMQKDFARAVSLEPTNYDRILSIYTVMSASGYSEEGKQYVQDALEKNSSTISGYDKGRLSYYIGDYETARVNLEQLQDNTDENVALMLGRTYEALGDYNYAANVYKTFLASNTGYPEVYNQLGLCCMKMGDYSAALEAFQEGKALGSSEYLQSLSFNEIVAYENQGNFEQAKTLMTVYRSAYPGDEKAAREETFLATR